MLALQLAPAQARIARAQGVDTAELLAGLRDPRVRSRLQREAAAARRAGPVRLRGPAPHAEPLALRPWFHGVLATIEELEYEGALGWFGLRFDHQDSWTLRMRDDATEAQRRRLASLLAPAPAR